MGEYIKPKHLAGLSEPHKNEIRHDLGVYKTGVTLSISQRILDIVLRGKARLLPRGILPETLSLQQIYSLFTDIPRGDIERQFGKVQFLTYRTYTLVNKIYGGTNEDVIRGLMIKGVSPNLHILYQLLKRCNSLEECIHILDMEELAHLKGTYNDYITTIVFSKCEKSTQKKRAAKYFARCLRNPKEVHIVEQLPNPSVTQLIPAISLTISEPEISLISHQTLPLPYHNRDIQPSAAQPSLEEEARAVGISPELLRIARRNANAPFGRMGNTGRGNKKGSKFGTKRK